MVCGISFINSEDTAHFLQKTSGCLEVSVLRLSLSELFNVLYFVFFSALWLFYYFNCCNVTNNHYNINDAIMINKQK